MGKAVRLSLAAAFVMLSSMTAQAADITIYAPNIVAGPLKKLAESWTVATGNKVIFAGFNVGRVRTAVEKDDPGDVVVAPTGNFTDFAPKLKSTSGRWRIPSAWWSSPVDISPRKIHRLAKKAGVLDMPTQGGPDRRHGGEMSASRIRRRQARPIKGMIGDAIVRGDAEFGGCQC
jgi:hypothetical protein